MDTTATDHDDRERGADDPVVDFFAHHGIKGMKWGVRKQAKSSGGGSDKPAPKKTASGEMTTTPKRTKAGRITEVPKVLPATNDHTRTATKNLTDAELKRAIDRINMEQKYHELTYIPTRKEKAAKFVGDLLRDLVKSELKNISKGKSPLLDMLKEASKTAVPDKTKATPKGKPDAPKTSTGTPKAPAPSGPKGLGPGSSKNDPRAGAGSTRSTPHPKYDSFTRNKPEVLEAVYDPKTGRFYVPGTNQ